MNVLEDEQELRRQELIKKEHEETELQKIGLLERQNRLCQTPVGQNGKGEIRFKPKLFDLPSESHGEQYNLKMGRPQSEKVERFGFTSLQIKIIQLEEQHAKITTLEDTFVENSAQFVNSFIYPKSSLWWSEISDVCEKEEYLNSKFAQKSVLLVHLINNSEIVLRVIYFLIQAFWEKIVLQAQFIVDIHYKIILIWNNFPMAQFVKYATNLKCQYEIRQFKENYNVKLLNIDQDKLPLFRYGK
ncbi:unnamed protein product [Paramecium primaurelia]|uniref:Uncharacterized protein n=1 Tax=Paramecium primaurelia TaxID=5886 RepID=A0A8S1QQH0_PARPR|nr:unnamed protein product [Paramecium primaurelia]